MLHKGKGLYKAFSIFRLCAALATAAAFIGLQFAPPKHHVIHPSPYTYAHAYADSVEEGGNSTIEWIDRENFVFECDVREGVKWRYCGLSLKFFDEPREDTIVITNDHFAYGRMKPVDLSTYSHFLMEMHYEGTENYIRVYMRNAFEMPKAFEEHNQQKFLNETLSRGEMQGQIKIAMGEFSVADWWMAQFQKTREDGIPTFDKIFEIGVDFPGQPPLGKHTFSVKKVVAVGQHFHKEKVYFGIIVFWLILGFFEFTRQAIFMVKRQKLIAYENSNLRKQALTDSLTSLANRDGVFEYVATRFPVARKDSVYVFVVDLDHFKNVNDSFGHDVGDVVLIKTAEALQRGLRSSDLLGRWGGEEFVIICQSPAPEIEKIIHRLRLELTKVVVPTPTGDILITMSLGAAKVAAGETFEEAFKRADDAVYAAKSAGRNTWKLA